MPKIIIHSDVKAGQPMPVLLTIDGAPTVELPINQEIDVTDEQLVALGHTDNTIELVIEGEAAEAPVAEEAPETPATPAPESDTVEQEPTADDTEQAPAPAAAAGGGDAGGGGDSGGAATDTSGTAQADPALVGGEQSASTSLDPASQLSEGASSDAAGEGGGTAAASTDELELTSDQEVAQPASGAPDDATGPSAGPELTPTPDAAPAEQPGEPQPEVEQPAPVADATAVEQAPTPAEPTASDKLEQAIELEQEALDELKNNGGEGSQA